MSNLPKRTPGAYLTSPVEPPDDGWFGDHVDWPADDPDESALAHYLRVTELPEGAEAEVFFRRLLDGLHKIDPNTDQ
ncbi:MAG: hypothetical protein ACRDU5_17125 [Mycobacterium sp.]